MHTFKNLDTTKYNILNDYFIEEAKSTLQALKDRVDKAKNLEAPQMVIQTFQRDVDKLENKLSNNTYKPTLTYKEGNKDDLLNTKITDLKAEYNSNDKLVALIINNEFKINFATRYCPIVTKI